MSANINLIPLWTKAANPFGSYSTACPFGSLSNLRLISSPTTYFIQMPADLFFFIVKAYSKGIIICHTTDILSIRFFYVVQWIKPPLLNDFQNSYLLPDTSFGLVIS